MLVLLDRDGVINQTGDTCVRSWDEFRFLPGSLPAIRRLTRAGARVAVITNQSMVGRGLVSADALEEINQRMVTAGMLMGARIDHVFYCPHAPWHDCACRKPRPGLLRLAAGRYREGASDCIYIGDGVEDLLAARAAAMPFGLVLTGRGRATVVRPECRQSPPSFVARSLEQAVDLVLG